MLELAGVRARRGGTDVLHGVDLGVDRGEVVGIVGPNGSGKSSLLRVICGLLRPVGGSVRFLGAEISAQSPEQICRSGIALVPEGRQIFGNLSVAENLAVASRGDRGTMAIATLLKRFPILAERTGQRAEQLSGGEQQQLAIARALVGEPRLLILDEPSMGLSPQMIEVVYGVLAELRQEGLTILLVEQNVTRTVAFCDRCAVLSAGVVRAEGKRADLERDPQLLRAYLGKQV
jgi:branched-chain amino acid transport system ATP-binding protein